MAVVRGVISCLRAIVCTTASGSGAAWGGGGAAKEGGDGGGNEADAHEGHGNHHGDAEETHQGGHGLLLGAGTAATQFIHRFFLSPTVLGLILL